LTGSSSGDELDKKKRKRQTNIVRNHREKLTTEKKTEIRNKNTDSHKKTYDSKNESDKVSSKKMMHQKAKNKTIENKIAFNNLHNIEFPDIPRFSQAEIASQCRRNLMFQRQTAAYCGLCSLNNINQNRFIDVQTLNTFQREFYRNLTGRNLITGDYDQANLQNLLNEIQRDEGQVHHDGWYPFEIITLKLRDHFGADVNTCNDQRLIELSQTNPVGAYIVIDPRRRHIFSLRKFSDNGNLWLFDSLKNEPVVANDYFTIISKNIAEQPPDALEPSIDSQGNRRLDDNNQPAFRITAETHRLRSQRIVVAEILNYDVFETFSHAITNLEPDISLFQVNDVIGGGIIRNNNINKTTEITNEATNDMPYEEDFFEEENVEDEQQNDDNESNNEPDISEDYIDEKFEYNCSKYKTYVCLECKRGYILNQKHNEAQFVCNACKNKLKHLLNNFFSDEKNQPDKIPAVLRPFKLTMIEQQLIALVHVSQNVYHRGKGSVATSGHCINYAQDITPIAKVLPHLPKDVPMIIIRAPNVSIQTPDMLIRRKHVLVWLEWLFKNNPVYRDYAEHNNLIIDYNRINDLPENGYVDDYNIIEQDFAVHREPPVSEQNAPNSQQTKNNSQMSDDIDQLSQVIQSSLNITTEKVPTVNKSDSEDNSESEDNETTDPDHPYYTGVVDPPPLVSEEEQLNRRLNELLKLDFPKHDEEPLNEYRTPNLATMAFPCLFPHGKGDPFSINETDERFYLKIKYLVNYCEIIHENGRHKKEFRFARDSRFVLWIFNIYYRRRCREIGTVYMSKCPGDANTTIQGLKALINMGAKNNVIRNMQKYMSQIQGTASYWFQCSEDLKAIIRDKGPPFVFFTFTYATHHDPHLHRVIGLKPNASRDEINKALEENTQIIIMD
jgi:hypothetical protein